MLMWFLLVTSSFSALFGETLLEVGFNEEPQEVQKLTPAQRALLEVWQTHQKGLEVQEAEN